ncbi:MAG: putative T4-like proximal tail fiber, partial [candidate division WS6 bacterium 34_10]
TDDQLEFSNDGTNWIALGDKTKSITLSAEYAGAVMSADGTNNTGFMTSDAEGTTYDSMNYYEWYSSETTLQDYDVRVRFTLPSDFASWGTNAFTFNYATEANSSTNNKVDFYVYEEGTGTVDGSSVGKYSATAGVWTTTSVAGSSLTDCNVAGETCVVIMRMYSANDSYVRVGDIDINYNREL